MRPNRLTACLGVALFALLLSTACSPDPDEDPGTEVTASPEAGSPEKDGTEHDDGSSPPASASPSESAGSASSSESAGSSSSPPESAGSSSPSAGSASAGQDEEETSSNASAGEMQTVDLDGFAVDLPADWEELDRSNVTTIRGDGTAADVQRVWRITMPDAPNEAVATVTYMEDQGNVDESMSEADRTALIRDWAGSTVDTLAGTDPQQLGRSLELNGLGCAPGSVTMSGTPELADVGDDGAGQAIRMDYRCQAFRDPRLGEVVGHRWVTTDVDGRRRDFHVTAYTGWLETIDEPDLTRRIVESIRPD